MKKKIAIIGMGELGQKHFSELRRSDYFELVALYHKGSSENFGPRYPIFDNLTDLFNVAKPDAVVITAPPPSHKELILKCLPFTKNIFVESPLAQSLAEAREINYAVTTNGTRLAVGYSDRYNPVIVSLLRELAKGDKIFSMSFINGFASEAKESTAMNALFRDVDLIRLLAQSEISSIEISKNISKERTLGINAMLHTKNGCYCTLMESNLYPIRRHGIEICTDSGVYFGDLISITLFKITPDGRVNLRVDRDDFSLRREHEAFCTMCDSNANAGLASVEDAIKIREIIS